MTDMDLDSLLPGHVSDQWRWLVGLAAATFCLVAFQSNAAAQSPISGNVNLKFGPYYPRIDEEFDEATPFADAFGTDSRVLAQLSGVYYLFKDHGKLGVGVSAGYTNFTGSSEIRSGNSDGEGGGDDSGSGDSGGNNSNDNGVSLEEETNFQVFPVGLIASYRWDILATEFNIPLAPKFEAGLDYYFWTVRDGSGDISVADGDRGAGAVPGYHFAGRLEFLLNAIDPETAAAFDMTWGVNRSYLFVEYAYSNINGFGDEHLMLGDSTWNAGLAFEF